jgi:hypothetical protein
MLLARTAHRPRGAVSRGDFAGYDPLLAQVLGQQEERKRENPRHGGGGRSNFGMPLFGRHAVFCPRAYWPVRVFPLTSLV